MVEATFGIVLVCLAAIITHAYAHVRWQGELKQYVDIAVDAAIERASARERMRSVRERRREEVTDIGEQDDDDIQSAFNELASRYLDRR